VNAETCNRVSALPDQFIGTPEIDAHRHSWLEPEEFEPKPKARFEHILVATNFSASATNAVRLAADLASRYHASLTVLHVINTNPDSASRHSGSADDLMHTVWQKAVSEMVRLKENLSDQTVPTETLIVEGIPWEQIAMQSQGFDLLILGRASPRPPWKFFSKHTSRRLLKEAGCPILSA
jgi:nucleotide-binding universal stress UspA family protein